jgi:hypothetical protein
VKVLVCGSRDWDDPWPIHRLLAGLKYFDGRVEVVTGGARGADSLAANAAWQAGLPGEEVPADWDRHGKAAGHIRNQQMLDLGPDVVLAFKNGWDRSLSRGGTEDMIRRSKAAGLPVYVIERA